jgi:hypothetical protein
MTNRIWRALCREKNVPRSAVPDSACSAIVYSKAPSFHFLGRSPFSSRLVILPCYFIHIRPRDKMQIIECQLVSNFLHATRESQKLFPFLVFPQFFLKFQSCQLESVTAPCHLSRNLLILYVFNLCAKIPNTRAPRQTSATRNGRPNAISTDPTRRCNANPTELILGNTLNATTKSFCTQLNDVFFQIYFYVVSRWWT